MLLVLDRQLTTVPGHPQRRGEPQDSQLNIVVIFTSSSATIAALMRAGSLAKSLNADITLIVPQVVPFPLPLTSPPVLLDFQESRFREIAEGIPVEIGVHLYLCRDKLETLKEVLQPRSLVVVGGRKSVWPTREERLARKLRRAGHDVIFTESV